MTKKEKGVNATKDTVNKEEKEHSSKIEERKNVKLFLTVRRGRLRESEGSVFKMRNIG